MTVTPASASSRASVRAKRSPAAEGARAPTIATVGSAQAPASESGPRTYKRFGSAAPR